MLSQKENEGGDYVESEDEEEDMFKGALMKAVKKSTAKQILKDREEKKKKEELEKLRDSRTILQKI